MTVIKSFIFLNLFIYLFFWWWWRGLIHDNLCLIFLTGLNVYQTLVVCELLELDKAGKMIIKDAAGCYTTDKLCYFNNIFTYTVNVTANITQEVLKPHLEEFKQEFAKFFYPVCITTLRNYLKKRGGQVNRRSKSLRTHLHLYYESAIPDV